MLLLMILACLSIIGVYTLLPVPRTIRSPQSRAGAARSVPHRRDVRARASSTGPSAVGRSRRKA